MQHSLDLRLADVRMGWAVGRPYRDAAIDTMLLLDLHSIHRQGQVGGSIAHTGLPDHTVPWDDLVLAM